VSRIFGLEDVAIDFAKCCIAMLFTDGNQNDLLIGATTIMDELRIFLKFHVPISIRVSAYIVRCI
jgi:hypothetical protein